MRTSDFMAYLVGRKTERCRLTGTRSSFSWCAWGRPVLLCSVLAARMVYHQFVIRSNIGPTNAAVGHGWTRAIPDNYEQLLPWLAGDNDRLRCDRS